jgi:hypothetical protein
VHKTRHAYRDGYRAHIAADPDTGLITACGLSAGNTGDAEAAPRPARRNGRPGGCWRTSRYTAKPARLVPRPPALRAALRSLRSRRVARAGSSSLDGGFDEFDESLSDASTYRHDSHRRSGQSFY